MRHLTLTQLNIYPIKSCGGIALPRALITRWGLEYDRSWMVVDAQGTFVTQRRHPRLALVQPTITGDALEIRAPDMPLLRVPLAAGDYAVTAGPCVTVWDDQLPALDAGEAAAGWFSRHLDLPVRLVRFDPQIQRICDPEWTRALHAVTQFSDGFPILLISEASLAGLNSRLLQRGRAPVPMQRFRPNVVIAGLDAHEEDRIHRLEFADPQVTLELVKPCKRCVTTTVDPRSGARDAQWPSEPLETLLGYRLDPQLKGATFGQNALIVVGEGAWLEVGQSARAAANPAR